LADLGWTNHLRSVSDGSVTFKRLKNKGKKKGLGFRGGRTTPKLLFFRKGKDFITTKKENRKPIQRKTWEEEQKLSQIWVNTANTLIAINSIFSLSNATVAERYIPSFISASFL
jgi:hypothetical protein